MAYTRILKDRAFWPFFSSMALGAFNDNFMRQALIALLAFGAAGLDAPAKSAYSSLATGLMILPFFLFSAPAGELADRYRKSSLLKAYKVLELVFVGLAAFLFFKGWLWPLMAAIFLMGLQSTLFGPVKYSLLPEILPERGLIPGNGLVEGATFLAIVLGTVAGAYLGGVSGAAGAPQAPAALVSPAPVEPAAPPAAAADVAAEEAAGPAAAGWAGVPGSGAAVPAGLMLVALAGLAFALLQPPSREGDPRLRVRANILLSSFSVLREARSRSDVWLSILAASWFWGVGSVLLAQTPVLVAAYAGGTPAAGTLMVSLFALGVAAGALAVQPFLKGEISARHAPAAAGLLAVLLTLFALAAATLPPAAPASVGIASFATDWTYLRLAALAFLTAAAAGFFAVPFNAIIQHRSPESTRSRVIAAGNVMNSLFMAAGALIAAIFGFLGAGIPQLFLFLALTAAAVAVATLFFLPREAIRQAASFIVGIIYDPEVTGLHNAERLRGPAVVMPNHTSFLDVALLACRLPRELTFAINPAWAGRWWVRVLLNFFRAHPVDPGSPHQLRGLVDALKAGETVVIFPEGRITTTGTVMKIHEGAALVASRAGVPVLPVVIEGAEHSLFGRMRKILRHPPERFRVRMRVFPPVELDRRPSPGESRRGFRARLAWDVYEIMLQCSFRARYRPRNLWTELLLESARAGRGRAIAEDASRRPASYRQIIRRSRAVGSALADRIPAGAPAGILLPNSLTLAYVLFGLWAGGRVPVMLNWSQGRAAMAEALRASGAGHVVSSRAFLAKAGHAAEAAREAASDAEAEMIHLEDLGLGLRRALRSLLWEPSPLGPDTPGAVLFTTGSEGAPKGAVLSHAALLANIRQALCAFELNEDDTLFNAMPAFHAFGLNIGMLLPLLSGIRSFNYPSPLAVQAIPELVYDTRATVVVGSDSFARAWGEAAHPYDFSAVRFMVLGAEKVLPSTRELYFRKLSLRVLEGYGVTEAAPVLAVGTRMRSRDGSVGQFLPGVRWRLEPVEGIREGGRLLVKGPNVMTGYLAGSEPGVVRRPPGGWHDTGDVARVDADGFLWIEGRLRRFAKLSGEMIPLAGVEAAAEKAFPGARLAVVSVLDGRKGERLVLACEGRAPDPAALRVAVREAGYPDLACPRLILNVPEIPLAPTGKTDIPRLTGLVERLIAAGGPEGGGSGPEAA
ncbi:MAG: AMP-binding protein [Deltaproteobacteria bacterium]|jgi:acyl-[acyl-carrier-protein]-phospholipid O-acyltransferase/long-chain-fatty-acid--[acyl-carrier-protein] ligase|nr:AMP-binding protein [Deltaproteobacteria bacterium]